MDKLDKITMLLEKILAHMKYLNDSSDENFKITAIDSGVHDLFDSILSEQKQELEDTLEEIDKRYKGLI